MNKEPRANTGQEQIASILDYFIIIILIAIIALSPWYYGSVGLTSQYYIHLACFAMLLIWLIKTNIHSKTIPYYPIYTPLFLFFGIAVASIIFSIYRYVSLFGSLNLYSYIIIFFIISQTLNNEKRVNFLIWVINIVGLFYCAYGILQYYGYLPKDFWAESNSLASRFVNSGPFGAFININIFLSLGAVFSYKRISAKIIFILFFVVFLISLILSKSRISWLVFIFTLLLFLVIFLKKPGLINIKSFIFIVIFGIVMTYILLQFKSLIWQRVHVMVPTQFQSFYQRIAVWKGTMKIILSHPFGTGMGTFQYIYPSYRIHSDRFFVDYAHSDFLQIASELGIVGLGIFIWFILKTFKQAFRALSGLSKYNFFILLSLICAVFSFVLQSLFDFAMHIPANAILFFVTIALITRYAYTEKKKALLPNKYLNLSTVIMIPILGLLFTNIYLSSKYYHLAKSDFSNMRWQEALSNYDKSIKLMPMNADNYAQKGSIYALKATLLFQPKEKIEYHKIAINNFKRAINYNSYQSSYYINLAWLYIEEKDHKMALKTFQKAIEVNPTDSAVYFPYADYCLEHNLLNEALKTYRKFLSLFINDDGPFTRLYGSYEGLFEKIYGYTKEYVNLKSAVPGNKLDVHLAFVRFLETKKMTSEALKEYREILAKYPNSWEAKNSLERLEKK